jgi:hypothetical protein
MIDSSAATRRSEMAGRDRLKLGLMLGYSGATLDLPVALVQRAEALGFDSVWTAEAYGSDATSPPSWRTAGCRSPSFRE